MNRRALAWVSAVVLAIVAVAWWLSAQAEVVEVPRPSEPIVERAEAPAPPAPVLEPPSPPEPVVVQPPAPPDAGLAEVEIEVFEGPKQLVGVRVELEGPGGRVSRPTDIMGFARFNLPTGSWRITAPRRSRSVPPLAGGSRADWLAAQTTPLEVTAPVTRFRLELPVVRKIRGRVVDSQLQPAPGVDVSWAPFGTEKRSTDTLGEFTIETTEPSVEVQAKRGTSRSMVRTANPGDPAITLVLEEWTQLKVDVTGGWGGGRARVRVLHRDEAVAHGYDDEPLLVPAGSLSVWARRNVLGRMHSGRALIDAKVGIVNRVEVVLTPTPPLKGTLVDDTGRPMTGLGVQIREVDPTTIALRTDGGVQPPRAAASTRTNHLGEFSYMPPVTKSVDPLYQVMVVELWRTQADPVLVKLDDAPLNIVVEPVP